MTLKCKLLKIINEFGSCYYYNSKKQLHRNNNLPAIEYANGDKSWYRDGKCHRDNDLPAIECANGDKCRYRNGVLLRDNDLPAIQYPNNSNQWYVNSKFIKSS